MTRITLASWQAVKEAQNVANGLATCYNTSMAFNPTAEQNNIVAAALTGGSVAVTAGAGTGKTSTLVLVADALAPKKGLYLAYNKAIQTDAEKKFPANVLCKTSHGLAYGACMRHPEHSKLMGKLNGNRVSPVDASKILNIPFNGFQSRDGQVSIQGWKLAGVAQATVSRFALSADDQITERHVPKLDGLNDEQMSELRTFILRFARAAWADVQSPAGRLQFTHDHYRKLWALTNPTIDADFIMYDEAQDAEPVMARVVEQQAAKGTQIIMVGDESQAIYGWRGAVDAISKFDADHRLALTQSFRFGAAVAEVANMFLTHLDAPLRIEGAGPESKVEILTDADAVLCRTNAEVIRQAMDFLGRGKKVAIVGGTAEIKKFCEAADKLMAGKGTTHPDLTAFKNWGEVVTYANTDEGADLRVMVKLITDYGTQAILDVCEQSTNEKTADVIVSTAHKSKGREWNRVKIAADFRAPDVDAGETLSRPEAMLLYVAVTRAQIVLDYSAVAWIKALVEVRV
jgi:hypothetical protein